MRIDDRYEIDQLQMTSTLEARVASHLLIQSGETELAAAIKPELDAPEIGWMEFLKEDRIFEENQNGDTRVIDGHDEAVATLNALAHATRRHLYFPTEIDANTLGRQQFMAQRLANLAVRNLAAYVEIRPTQSTGRFLQVALPFDMGIANLTPEQSRPLAAPAHTMDYVIRGNGWDAHNLTPQQGAEMVVKGQWLQDDRDRLIAAIADGTKLKIPTKDEQQLTAIIRGRQLFTAVYCAERRWNPKNLSESQFDELRAQPGYEDPVYEPLV